MNNNFLDLPISEAYKNYPFFKEFFLSFALLCPDKNDNQTVREWIDSVEYFTLDEIGLDREEIPELMDNFITRMIERINGNIEHIESITIIGGHDKNNHPEIGELILRKGDVVSIVGPTGAGKSRLLADIEWLAQGDTPTGRTIKVNGQIPPSSCRFSIDNKLVAQLSQNMNFVMDISVEKFIGIHCQSHVISDIDSKIEQIIRAANTLAGEPIDANMPVTSLSGGQSRALMIADTAYISNAPIVLIDEIENAGINRKLAIDLLTKAEKIVIMATHNPVLALQASRRIVIKNGGIVNVIETTAKERCILEELESISNKLLKCRETLRNGETISSLE